MLGVKVQVVTAKFSFFKTWSVEGKTSLLKSLAQSHSSFFLCIAQPPAAIQIMCLHKLRERMPQFTDYFCQGRALLLIGLFMDLVFIIGGRPNSQGNSQTLSPWLDKQIQSSCPLIILAKSYFDGVTQFKDFSLFLL